MDNIISRALLTEWLLGTGLTAAVTATALLLPAGNQRKVMDISLAWVSLQM